MEWYLENALKKVELVRLTVSDKLKDNDWVTLKDSPRPKNFTAEKQHFHSKLRKVLDDHPFLNQDATSLVNDIRSGVLSVKDLVEAAIKTSTVANEYTNFLVFDCYQEARERAKEVDQVIQAALNEEKNGSGGQTTLPPFLGVPIFSKSSYEHVRRPYTMGIWRDRNKKGERDAPLVQVMEKRLGFIVLGGTNVSEACMWYETHNPLYGWTVNPFDLSRSPGGSSGGSVVPVATGAVTVGLTADVGGSTRIPCSFQGQFGHKPSGGLLTNLGGHHDHCSRAIHRICQPGVACKTVRDLIPIVEGLRDWSVHEVCPEFRKDFEDAKEHYLPRFQLDATKEMCDQWLKSSVKSFYHGFSKQANLSAEEPIVFDGSYEGDRNAITDASRSSSMISDHYSRNRWKVHLFEMVGKNGEKKNELTTVNKNTAVTSGDENTNPTIRTLTVHVLDPTYGYCRWSLCLDVLLYWSHSFILFLLQRFGGLTQKGKKRVRKTPGFVGSLGLVKPSEAHMQAVDRVKHAMETDFDTQNTSEEKGKEKADQTKITFQTVNFHDLEADWWFEFWGARLKMNQIEPFADQIGLENSIRPILWEITKSTISAFLKLSITFTFKCLASLIQFAIQSTGNPTAGNAKQTAEVGCQRVKENSDNGYRSLDSQITDNAEVIRNEQNNAENSLLRFANRISNKEITFGFHSKFTMPALGLALLENLFHDPKKQEQLDKEAVKLKGRIKNTYLQEERHYYAEKSESITSGNVKFASSNNLRCHIDASIIIMPTLPFVAPKHGWSVPKFLSTPYTSIWNCLEMPSTQVPITPSTQVPTTRSSLPIGIQIVGSSDSVSLSVASYLEKTNLAKAWGRDRLSGCQSG